ncbi:MAG: hypothetical protein WC249_04340 [Patescibacteria group bacterium]|jgi:hypothetical protein
MEEKKDSDTGQVNGSNLITNSQVVELTRAMSRRGYGVAEFESLIEGKFLDEFLIIIRKSGEEAKKQNFVDLDADPLIPPGWSVEEHQKGGLWKFNQAKIFLYFSEKQKRPKESVSWSSLRKELSGKNVANANLLDFYLANPHLIPSAWRGKRIPFWGTIYSGPFGINCVRYLDCDDNLGWRYYAGWFSPRFDANNPAAIII